MDDTETQLLPDNPFSPMARYDVELYKAIMGPRWTQTPQPDRDVTPLLQTPENYPPAYPGGKGRYLAPPDTDLSHPPYSRQLNDDGSGGIYGAEPGNIGTRPTFNWIPQRLELPDARPDLLHQTRASDMTQPKFQRVAADYRSFTATYGPLAEDIANETGMDQSVILGIIGQESGWGANIRHNNNLFGISPNGEANSYDSVQSAAQDFVRLMKEKYPDVGKFTPRAQAAYLVSKGYNTVDPNYEKSIWANAGSVRSSQAQKPGDMPDYTAMYGDPNSKDFYDRNITTITTPGGVKLNVNRSAADAFRGFTAELEARGYKIGEGSGGYNNRTIAGTNTPSAHAYGTAIDINPAQNPYSKDANGGTLTTDLPPDVGEMAAKHGLTWGGAWGDRKDPMHFEFRGTPNTTYAAGKPTTMTDAAAPQIDTSALKDKIERLYPTTPQAGPASQPDAIQPPQASDTKALHDKVESLYPTTPATEVPAYHRSFTQDASDLLSGVRRGASDVVDTLGRGLNYISPFGGSSADLAHTQQIDRDIYDKEHGDSGFASAGRIGGQVAASVPLLGGVGAGMTALGRVVLGGAAKVAPEVVPALEGAGRFVTGQAGGAGLLGRTVQAGSRATQGAALGEGTSMLATGDIDPTSKENLTAAGVGAGAGVVAPLVAEGVSRMRGGTSSMPPAVADFINGAKRDYGIDLRASQVPQGLPKSAQLARSVSSYVPLSGTNAADAPVLRQWREAVAVKSGIGTRVGQPTPALTPGNIAEAQKRIADYKKGIELLPADPQAVAPHIKPLIESAANVGGADTPAIIKTLQSTVDGAENGTPYGVLLKQLDNAAKISGSPTIQKSIAETKAALQTALEDQADTNAQRLIDKATARNGGQTPTPEQMEDEYSIQQLSRISRNPDANPGIQADHAIGYGSAMKDGRYYHQLRGEEHNLDVLSKAPVGADGQITPEGLNQALANSPDFKVNPNYKQKVVANDKGAWVMSPPTAGETLPDLARIGASIGKAPSEVEKYVKGAAKLLEWGGLGYGHLLQAGHAIGTPLVPGAGLAGMTANRLMNMYLNSKRLTNRLVANSGQGVAPWVNRTQQVISPLAADTGNALNARQDH